MCFQERAKEKCFEYKYHSTIKRRTHFHYLQPPSPPQALGNQSISLVTQLQLNRLDGLERLLVAWEGPASVALYLSDEEAHRFANFVNATKSLRTRKNVSFHVVFKRQVLQF